MNADGGYERAAARRGKRAVQEDLLHQLSTAAWARTAKLEAVPLPSAA
jgi:hypothetical protein